MKVRIWLVTRERDTWITAAEILFLGLVLFTATGPAVRLLLGLPLLAHIGYRALTSLPMGSVPGRPVGRPSRRHYDLRARVVRFLDEVKRVEDYAHRATVAKLPPREVQQNLLNGQRRVLAAAQEVAKETGRHALRAGRRPGAPVAPQGRPGLRSVN